MTVKIVVETEGSLDFNFRGFVALMFCHSARSIAESQNLLGILMSCACHPWRNCLDFDKPQSRHPVEPFGPQEALLLVGCADRASPSHAPPQRREKTLPITDSRILQTPSVLCSDKNPTRASPTHMAESLSVGGVFSGRARQEPSPEPTGTYLRRPLNTPPTDSDGSKPQKSTPPLVTRRSVR